MICDVCGYESETMGMDISLIKSVLPFPEYERIKEIFGKVRFYICYKYLLEKLGVKQKT